MLSALKIHKTILTGAIITGLVTISATTALYAQNYPRGCEPNGFTYSGNYLVLNQEGRQTFFLIQNKTNNTIQLERHETRDVFMSPKLEVNLAGGAWSAFSSDEQNFNFQCFTKKNETETSRINCNEVLDVCQYPRARFALSNMGNYWVSTNKAQNLVIKEAVAKGIYLKW